MKEYVRLILILLIPLFVVLAYSYGEHLIYFNATTLSKVNVSRFRSDILLFLQIPNPEVNNSAEIMPSDTLECSSFQQISSDDEQTFSPDTTSKRILFFGDSMIEGLAMRFADYARENGHELYSVCWYGSTTSGWAANIDTLQSFLNWSQADYVVVSLGGNELKVKDVDRRAENIRVIQRALGNRPTVWIAPPSWVKNPTITEVIRGVVGDKRYFDSTRLTYTRGSDKMHPTFGSAARWMDSIAVWMSSEQTAHPIEMNFPKATHPRKWKKKLMFPKK